MNKNKDIKNISEYSNDKLINTINFEKYKNSVYEEIIIKLTGAEIEDICPYENEKFTINLPQYINNSEFQNDFKKLKNQLQTTNTFIESLKLKNAKLQMNLSTQNEKFNKIIKSLNNEIYALKSSSQLENYKNYIQSLQNSRKNISLELRKNDTLENNFNDNRKFLIKDQIQLEIELIQNIKSLLRDLFEQVYSYGGSNTDVSFEVNILKQKLNESRSKLSIWMKKDEYISFIKDYQKDIKHILELLHIKCSSVCLSFEQSSYENWILKDKSKKDYLFCCDKYSEIFERLTYWHLPCNELMPFEIFNNWNQIHFTANMKDLLENILITSHGINNIILPTSINLDKDCFLVLESITDINRIWTYDSYLLNTIRNLSKRMSAVFISEFRDFYKDCFSHNNYIHNFEEILAKREIKRWKNYKILYENIRILADEYMFGEIVRDIISKKCKYEIYYTEGCTNIDIIKGSTNSSTIKDFELAQKLFSKGEPYIDEQEFFTDVFDNLNEFNDKEFNEQYKRRWKEFLKVYYK